MNRLNGNNETLRNVAAMLEKLEAAFGQSVPTDAWERVMLGAGEMLLNEISTSLAMIADTLKVMVEIQLADKKHEIQELKEMLNAFEGEGE